MKVPGEANATRVDIGLYLKRPPASFVGGKIYFHEHQRDPSFYGGEIVDVERIVSGQYQNAIVFKFVFSAECRGLKDKSARMVTRDEVCS